MGKKVSAVCQAADQAGVPGPFCFGAYWDNPATVPEAAFHLDRCGVSVLICGYGERTAGLARQLEHANFIVAHSQAGFALSHVIGQLDAGKRVILVDPSGAMNNQYEEFIGWGGEVAVLSTDSAVTAFADWYGALSPAWGSPKNITGATIVHTPDAGHGSWFDESGMAFRDLVNAFR